MMYTTNTFLHTLHAPCMALLFAACLIVAPAGATPLTGSGSHLAIPSPNPGAPLSQVRAITSVTPQTGWTGTWTAPVQPAWVGSFTATGPVPTGNSNPTSHTIPTGITLYDFTALPNGELPVGTYFRFGDIDLGSTVQEVYRLTAFDSSGAITTPWLDEVIGVTGTTPIISGAMPRWSFNAGVYTFDGTTVYGVGNPNLAIFLTNNTSITSLEVSRSTEFQNFALYAPIVPEPATGLLLGLGFGWLIRRRHRT